MKIKKNDKITEFLMRASQNIVKMDEFDDFIKLNDKKEKELLSEMKLHDESINSIYVDTTLITENPYYKNINLEDVDYENIKLTNKFLQKKTAFQSHWMLPDKNKELNDYLIYSAFKKGINIPMLVEDKEIWMSPTLAEQNTINPFVEKATGNVLTFGLGIGYFPYMCSLKENVTSITIVELNQKVIDLFKKCILPQFNTDIEIKIIQGDMFDYFNEDFLNKFDYTFVDVWKSNSDGVEIIEQLLEKLNYKGNIDYWIEFSCYVPFRQLMFIYFNSIYYEKLQTTLSYFSYNPELKNYLTKIHRYFREKDIVVTDENILKDYLYDINLIREILSIKL